ncbi:MAG: FtsX-like permease family protein [Actinomycetota bacterium]
MAAVWMRLHVELRARWRAWLALGLIFGIGSGAAMAALAGARRTETAYPRFVEAQDGFDALSGGGGTDKSDEDFLRMKTHPAVASAEEIVILAGQFTIPAKGAREEVVVGFPEAFVVSNPSGRVPYVTNRAKILEGRLPDRANPHELVVPFTVRDRYGIRTGDQIILGMGFDDEFGPVEEVPVEVVGVVAAPGDFEAVGQTLFSILYGTPAMYERYGDLLPQPLPLDIRNLGFHLKGGSSAAAAFKQSIERELNIDIPVIEPVIRSGVQKTMRLYAVALLVVGALIAVATVAIVGQTIARQTTIDSSDHPTLRALGFSPSRLVALGFLRAAIIGVIAALIAAVTAGLASPLFPIGPARTAEPSPGLTLDATVIGLGCGALFVLIPLITLLPSLRAVRAAALERDVGEDTRRSLIARAASGLARSPATSAGLRMALEPGRGRSSVPVRSTILAVAMGVAAVSGSLVVGESLTNLIEEPALAGFTYDALLPDDMNEPTPEHTAERVAALRQIPYVDRLAVGTALNIVVGGADSFLVAFAEDGEIGYAIIDGRPPTDMLHGDLPEIALGAVTMRRLKLKLGDTVEFAYPPEGAEDDEEGEGEEPPPLMQRARIVGVVAVPPLPFAVTEPGEGGLATVGAVNSFNPDHRAGCCYVAFEEGTDLDEAQAALEEAGFEVFPRTKRTDLATLERMSRLPILLSAIFAVIGAAALAHVLTTSIRRRRRELAILKTLGFTRGQVRTAVAWQVSTTTILAVLIGIPGGIALGRWGWGLVAAYFAVVPVAVAPLALVAVVIPAALLLGNIVAAVPARIAARTKPALVLRTE